MTDEAKGELDPAAYEAEARERWGHTEAYKESARRAKGYTKEDLARIKAEMEDLEARMADLMSSGVPAEGDAAMAAAEQARLHIDRWYYACSPRMHAALADMYTADPRFRAHYEDRAEGLAEYVSTAIKANAVRAG
jgi:hypothetical protein